MNVKYFRGLPFFALIKNKKVYFLKKIYDMEVISDIKIPKKTFLDIEKIAEANNKTISEIIVIFLENYLTFYQSGVIHPYAESTFTRKSSNRRVYS